MDGDNADVAVVGAGIVGLSTAFFLGELGASVTVYERGVPGNGQSGGEARIFRHLHDDHRLAALARESRAGWRSWEERFGEELLSRDGVVALGAGGPQRLEVLREVGGIRVELVHAVGVLPLLAPLETPAVFDVDGGALRARAAVSVLSEAVRDRIVFDEVLSVKPTGGSRVEVRAGGVTAEHDRVVLCAGRGTVALGRTAGLALPVRQSAHVRLTFQVRGEPPAQLACLLDGGTVFGANTAYGDPMPGNAAYAVGLGETTVREDSSLVDPDGLGDDAERIIGYVSRALPGLEPRPIDARHCWVTALPWSHDGIAVWEADGLIALAGNNLFKHAPVLGQALARAAVGEGLREELRPHTRLGLPPAGRSLP